MIAFIGLGIMGSPMAGHLLAAGHAVTVHTRTRSKAADLLSRGATWSESPGAATLTADVVFICVTDTPDVQVVIEGNNGILTGARAGLIVGLLGAREDRQQHDLRIRLFSLDCLNDCFYAGSNIFR